MPLPAEWAISRYQLHRLTFGRQQLAATVTASALNQIETRAASGTFQVTGYVMPWKGSIVAVTISSSANKTAGVLTVTPTIAGTAITSPAAIVAVPLVNATATAYANADGRLAPFAQGAVIGVKITTDGSYAPTTNDVEVEVWVVLEDVVY